MRSFGKGPPARSPLARLERLTLAVLILVASILLFPGLDRPSDYEGFEEGQVAPSAVVAPFDFDVLKPAAELEFERDRVRETVPAYFRRDDAIRVQALSRLDDFATRLGQVTRSPGPDTLRTLREIGKLGVELSDRVQRALLSRARRDRVLRAGRDFINEVMAAGLADRQAFTQVFDHQRHMLTVGQSYSQAELRETLYFPSEPREIHTDRRVDRYAQEVARERFADDSIGSEAFRAIVGAFMVPNVTYDRAETERIQQAEIELITAVNRRVLKGEMIIDAHRIVTPDAMRALDGLREELRIRRGSTAGWQVGIAIVGRLLITGAILAFSIVYLGSHRPRVYADTRKLVLLTITALVIFASASVVLNVLHQPWLLIPVAAGSMVVSLLIDAQLGVFFTLVSVVVVGINADLGLNFISGSLLAGFTGVYAVRRVRHRAEILKALLLVAIAYIFSVSAQGMIKGQFGLTILTSSGLGVLNALIATAMAVFLIPLLEYTCGVTTDLTLLELSDLNRPLLKRLMLEAPGTYHHSMVMGTLAEAACEAAGANSLLGRVQCYYHDIGKVNKPEYFVENIALNPRARNPHDRLQPSMSCLILESHVREGVALAREHKIPGPLIAAIREHHGTSEMSFFYEKARTLDPSVERDEFRYPGPRPQTKETAIVMLADGVEAASRVLTDPRPSRLRGLVNRIIEGRVEAGELEECGLTLADLARIREAFVLVLTGMFHGRIRYPSDVDAATLAGDRPSEPQRAEPARIVEDGNDGSADL